MRNPFRSKTKEEIESKARASERKICEEHYLEELNSQRERFSKDAVEKEAKHQLEKKAQEDKAKIDIKNAKDAKDKQRIDELAKLKDKYVTHLKSLKAQIVEKERRVDEAQRAWQEFKEFLPDAIRLSNMLKIKAQIERDNSASKYQEIAGMDDNFESLGRKVKSMIPHIEGLLAEPEERKK